jgi:hypothetical protein
MAKGKTLNRRELREQSDAAEAAEKADGGKKEKAAAGDKPVKKKATRAKKKPVEVRLKAFWGIYNQSLKRVALYEYADRKAAEKKAAELSASGKSPHFVKLVKEEVAAAPAT